MTKQEVADQEAARFIAEMNASVEADIMQLQGDMEAALPTILAMRQQRSTLEGALKDEEAPVRRYLELNQPTRGPLVDTEHGITAELKERHGANVYEMERMPDDLVLLLHKIGALKVEGAVVKVTTNSEIKDRIKVYERPGPVTQVLEVKQR